MSDQAEDRDATADPREQGTGSGGYPESEQEDATPREGTESGPEGGTDNVDAPDTSSDEESDPGTATGNPRNAG